MSQDAAACAQRERHDDHRVRDACTGSFSARRLNPDTVEQQRCCHIHGVAAVAGSARQSTAARRERVASWTAAIDPR
jgi:hypothetical protein